MVVFWSFVGHQRPGLRLDALWFVAMASAVRWASSIYTPIAVRRFPSWRCVSYWSASACSHFSSLKA